jgi:hypothetical protein
LQLRRQAQKPWLPLLLLLLLSVPQPAAAASVLHLPACKTWAAGCSQDHLTALG